MQAALSHYRILEQIGAGGMGVVYRAHDEELDRDVAVKVLPSGAISDEAARKRFRKEALALSKLNHPNVETVHEFGHEAETDFLVTEFIPGLTLDKMLASGPLSEREIANLGSQLCEGLAAAHEHGIIHRDLKPGNIRITPDARLKILDFGLAKIFRTAAASDTDATVSLTETQQVSGTLPYMAPEQLLNEKLDARTDIWAAGCVLYEMATSRRPFLGCGPALTDAILHHPAPAASRLNPRLSPGLEAIVLKCLEKDPALRYVSASEVAVDLHRLTSISSMIPVVPPPRRVRTRKFLMATAVLAVLAVAGAALHWFLRNRTAGPPSAPTEPSIAVLPFVNLSSDKEQEYFSDGLAEELLNALAKIPQLRVTARTSSFQFKGKNEDLRTIGEKLNVATVLEGSVRKQGTRVRISAQLIKVSDGFHLWSATYERELSDIFAVQDEIAQSVAASLKVTLLGPHRGSASAPGRNVDAYNAVLQGRYFSERSSQENQEKAVEYYEQAIKIDPTYAPAWAALAGAHFKQSILGYVPLDEGSRKAREAADRALALDPNLAGAHTVICGIKMNYDWDWTGAQAACQRALTLQPGGVSHLRASAVLVAGLGRLEEALALARRAVEIDPLSIGSYQTLGYLAYCAGRLDEAHAALKKALELNPERPIVRSVLSSIYLARGNSQEALAEIQREPEIMWRLQGLALTYYALGRKSESDRSLAELVAKYHSDSAYQIAEVYAFRREATPAFKWLERAYTQRDPGLPQVKYDPLLKNLEDDPRYAAFLRKMRLPLN